MANYAATITLVTSVGKEILVKHEYFEKRGISVTTVENLTEEQKCLIADLIDNSASNSPKN